jgi:solute:Na+ symporter, SSS family
LSTASGALLAPATVLAENILKPYTTKYNMLSVMRLSVFLMAIVAVILAFNNKSIFELVSLASSFGLVSLFLPFSFTLFISRTNEIAVIGGMLGGLISWAVASYFNTEIPSIFYGLAASLLLLLMGIYLQYLRHDAAA